MGCYDEIGAKKDISDYDVIDRCQRDQSKISSRHKLQNYQQQNSTTHNGCEELNTCDTINLGQTISTQHNKPTDFTPETEEASKKEDDFYDAEEHIYAVVNKKKAKKTSEDGEGEREELPNNDSALVEKS